DILHKIGKDAKPKVEVDLKPGDMVQMKSGPFAGSTGPVVEVDPDKAKIKFRITVFGRETDVEADYSDLEKI
ncbi:MAG: KOW motif-containing protein, partial [Cloacibacillus sp.]